MVHVGALFFEELAVGSAVEVPGPVAPCGTIVEHCSLGVRQHVPW